MDSVIIFDLGKVLVNFDYSIAARKIASRSTRAPEDLHAFFAASPLLAQYETGMISRADLFEAVQSATGFQGTLEEFGAYFAEIFSEIPEMIALHAEVKSRGFKTYIFSNTNDLAIEHVRRDFPFFANFDGYIYSYEVGAMKPERAIYEAMERLCGRSGSDLVYLDDRAENVAAGAARGWRTILHQSPAKTRTALVKSGVLPA
jgi:FMN phosphatase YigB (HAD superfamily)